MTSVSSKTAGWPARLALSALNYSAAAGQDRSDQHAKMESQQRIEAQLELEQLRSQQANQNLRHTDVPSFVPAGSDLPVGMDAGMVRLASIMTHVGAERAKTAGIGDFMTAAKTLGQKALPALQGLGSSLKSGLSAIKAPAMATAAGGAPAAGDLLSKGKQLLGGGRGLTTNLALAGGTLAAGALAKKSLSGATRAMSSEAGPPVYGMGKPSRGVGYQMPFGVNEYGQPQVGGSLV